MRPGPLRLAVLALLAMHGACAAGGRSGVVPATPPVTARASGDLEVLGHADYGWRVRPLGAAAQPFALERLRGRVLFINLWATWCLPCIAELGSIGALGDSLRTSDVAFLLVSPEEPAVVEAFVRRHGVAPPVYVEEQELPAAFGLEALPTTFVVDRAGRIVLRHRGAANWDAAPVRAFLRHLDAAPAPRRPAGAPAGTRR